MSDGRRSLVGTFVVTLLLTFFVDKPAHLSWGGVTISENKVWVCLLAAHAYFCLMAYTKGAFAPINTAGATYLQHLSDPSVRAHRIGTIVNLLSAWISAVGAVGLISWGLVRNACL
jgi:hypothetical protein